DVVQNPALFHAENEDRLAADDLATLADVVELIRRVEVFERLGERPPADRRLGRDADVCAELALWNPTLAPKGNAVRGGTGARDRRSGILGTRGGGHHRCYGGREDETHESHSPQIYTKSGRTGPNGLAGRSPTKGYALVVLVRTRKSRRSAPSA